MPKYLDLTGLRFGRLIAKRRLPNKLYGTCTVWECECDCGKTINAIVGNLRSGNTTSCGCFHSDASSANMRKVATKHGFWKHPLYPAYKTMIARCHNPKSKSYRAYGAKGITVCDRWRNDFMRFVQDMGPQPTRQHSVDRILGTRGYEPDNCRWATPKEQAANSSRWPKPR